MRRKWNLLSPFVSDVAALAVLGLSIATVLGIASLNGQATKPSYNVVTSVLATSL